MNEPLIFDTETTTFQKGHPFARRNRLIDVGALRQGRVILNGDATELPNFQREVTNSTELVGFNLKFDLHWLRRVGIDYSHCRVWDCQLAEFLLTSQKVKYPSLQGTCDRYGITGKVSLVKEEYWDKGVDTPDIPEDVRRTYLSGDLLSTWGVYQKQLADFQDRPQLYRLFRLQCQDLLVLAEMEWNGLLLDTTLASQRSKETHVKLAEVEEKLAGLSPSVALNFDSPDDVSTLLYGGTVTRERRVIVGLYATGQKLGQPRFKIERDVFELPRLTTPVEGSGLQKEGLWSTDEKTLRQLRGVKPITTLLLERARLSKLLDYFDGMPALFGDMDWSGDTIHGQLNQVSVITGRLSATKPNQQNLNSDAKELIISEYAD